MGRKTRGLFVVTLGLFWIVVSVALSLPRAVTGGLAALALVVAAGALLLAGKGSEAGKAGRLGKWWRGLSYRNKVNTVAAAVAVTVGMGAGALLLAQPIPDGDTQPAPADRTTTTTHSTESGSNKDGPSNKTTDAKVTETKKSAEDRADLLGRAVDNSAGVILIRLGLALLSAFLAGLVAQRIALGKYGVKLPFGLGEFTEISDEQAKSVTDDAKKDATLKDALETSKRQGPEEDLMRVADPRIELVALRAKVESELRAKAQEEGVDADAPIGQLIDDLSEKKDIGPHGRSALRGVIELGGQAAQGAEIEPGVEKWLVDEGQHLSGAIAAL